MFLITRRQLIKSAIAASAVSSLPVFAKPSLTIGITDWNLHLGAKPDAVPLAAKLGFQGVQISFGTKLIDNHLAVDDPETTARYRQLARENNIALDGGCVDRLHVNGLKSDPLAPRWVRDGIRLTKALDARVLLLPFFGRWAIEKPAEMDYVGDALREIAPDAEKAGVILGIEDTISAENNVRIMERARSKNVLVYYDVGNSTEAGFDVVKEIRWLGKDRICQFHLKDNPHFLGEGKIKFSPIMRAIADIGYSGWANLETDAREGELEPDMRRNLAYIRQVMQQT